MPDKEEEIVSNSEELVRKSNKTGVAIRNQSNTSLSVETILSTVQKVNAFKGLIESLSQSNLLRDNFAKIQNIDGKDELVVDTGDVIACMSMAASVGIDPISAIALGRSFTKTGFMKATMAASMGMNPLACMELFHAIPKNQEGSEFTISLGVKGMQSKALEAGIITTIVEDYVPVLMYASVDGLDYLGTNLNPNMALMANPQLVNKDDPAQAEAFRNAYIKAKTNNHIPCFVQGVTRRTTIHGKRLLNGQPFEASCSYELQEAINSGLAKGTKTDGTESKGKANWTNPKDMVFNRSLGRLHKILSGDVFKGIPFTSDIEDGQAFETK